MRYSDKKKDGLHRPSVFWGFSGNVIMQDLWISMYLVNMAAIALLHASHIHIRSCSRHEIEHSLVAQYDG